MTWYTLFERIPSVDAGPGPGWTVRQPIPVASYNTGAPDTGTQLRVTYRAGSNSLNLPRSFLGHAATSGDTIDFDGTQVQLFFTSAAAAFVATGGTLVSDGAAYSFVKTKPLVISAETSFPSVFLGGTDASVFFTNVSGATHAGDTDVTVASLDTKYLWSKVEVFFTDPAGNPTCTINKTTAQQDPTSGGTINFAINFNKGVTGFTASDIDISTSTVGGTLVKTLVGQDFNFILSVTGMFTVGDVTATIPAGVCQSADSLFNNASTSTDNTVHWDPDVIDPTLPNVYEVTTIDRNMLRIEVREPPNTIGHYEVLSTPDSGTGTYAITGAANNGFGQVRLTTSTAGASINGSGQPNGNIYILNMTASPVSNGIGGQRIRCQIYDTDYFTHVGATRTSCTINHARGTIEANCGENFAGGGAWTIAVIDATHFDLVANNASPPVPSAFVHAYTGGGVIQTGNGGGNRVAVHSVAGTTEANGGWIMARSGLTTIDLADSYFTNTYTSGGTLIFTEWWVQRPNPALGGALDFCFLPSRFGDVQKFQDPPLVPSNYLNRAAAIVPGNYSLTGGLSVTSVFRKIKPYTMSYGTYGSPNFSTPNCSFRHYYYLQLSGNLVSGTTYTLAFPSGTGLPPKSFVYNDKVTRCSAITADQNGHRPSDNGKIAYLAQWVPDYGTYGDYAYPAVTNWHIIDSGGTIIYSAGAAPALRTTATSAEGISFDDSLTTNQHNKSPPLPIYQKGASLKVSNITRFSPGHVTVDDGSTLTNGQLINFAALTHMSPRGTGGPDVGMSTVETDVQGNPRCYRVSNLSGNAFDLSVAKSVTSATVASGGSGYAVGNTINLSNRVQLEVLTISGSAIATVSPVPNEFKDFNIAPAAARNSEMSGWVDYPYTLPSNPQAQVTSSGGGTGATFNLTWVDNPFDTTLLAGRFGFGNADTTSAAAFATSVTQNKGNLLYKTNELGNRGGTNIYGMDYSAATLTAGTYYIYLPNIGVSDPIVVRESAWYDVATCYLKGLYHERSGCTLDGRFGYTTDGPGFKPRTGFKVHKSLVPYGFSRYSLDQTSPSIYEATSTFGQSGGYDPYITTEESVAYGSHYDAGDWDSRINETGPYYWGILDVWQHLSAPSRTSLSNQGTPTLIESGLDPVFFAGTDSMPSPIAEVIFGIEMYRLGQESYGGVIGGMNYGEGIPLPETATKTAFSIYTWAPDHFVTLKYVFVAAKLAKVLSDLGYTSLAAAYQASAVAGWNWAELIHSNTAARDAYYLPFKTAANWTTAQYNSALSTMESVNYFNARAGAAAALFNLTGSSTYKAICDGRFPVGDPDGAGMFYQWEYANATGATAAIKDAIHSQNLGFIERVLLLYADAPDVTYYSPSGAGRWPMNFGGGNNVQFGHHLMIGAITYASIVSPVQPTDAARCRKALQNWFGFRHGGNQLGLCMTKGLGVRNNRETLHINSLATGQAVPIGLCSEGWCNLFPALPLALGTSNIDVVQHPQADTELVLDDPTIPYREQYPSHQLAWPRWEFMMEIHGAIEHAEFTVQQQIIPAYSATMYLHGWDGNTATSGITTSTVLVSSLNPSGAGVSVDFTATVTPVSGGPVTGSVAFKDAGATIATVAVNGSGVAVYTTSALTPATHPISAFYIGDGTYDSSTSNTVSQVVTGTSSSTALTSSLNPSVLGDSVTFTATVTGAGSPTGTVAFKDGATTIGTGTLIAGVATFATSLLAIGTHSITGVYSGDGTFITSTSNTVSQVVNSAAPPGPITLLPQACM